MALDTKLGWILSGPVNNLSVSVNNSVSLSQVMEVQSEFMDTNNALKQDLMYVYMRPEVNSNQFEISDRLVQPTLRSQAPFKNCSVCMVISLRQLPKP